MNDQSTLSRSSVNALGMPAIVVLAGVLPVLLTIAAFVLFIIVRRRRAVEDPRLEPYDSAVSFDNSVGTRSASMRNTDETVTLYANSGGLFRSPSSHNPESEATAVTTAGGIAAATIVGGKADALRRARTTSFCPSLPPYSP